MRLVEEAGLSIREVARDLGVSEQTVRNWVAQRRVDRGDAEGLTSQERAELGELRRRVKILEQERDILKRAAAWFAKETGATP